MSNSPLTDRNAKAWADMGIALEHQLLRVTEWAAMLEKRIAELDPNYQTYPWGREIVLETVKSPETLQLTRGTKK